MNTGTVIIMIDGVLRKIVGDDPIRPGILLYRALASVFSVALVGTNPRKDEDWLKEQGIEYDMLHSIPDVSHANLVDTIRFDYGYHIEMVVEPDPEQAATLFDAGYTVLLYAHPYYSHPSWRPLHDAESDAKGWAELRGVVMRDRLERAVDERTESRDD